MNSIQLILTSAGCILSSFMFRPLSAPLLMGGAVSGVMAEQRRKYEQMYVEPLQKLADAAWLDQQEQIITYRAMEVDHQLELQHQANVGEIGSLIATLERQIQPESSKTIEAAATEVRVAGLPYAAALANQGTITVEGELEAQHGDSSPLFEKFLKQPHNWVCGKTNGGKTFLLLRLVKDWIEENPDGRVYILDRNFGKPDRVTGEIFDWNGLPQSIIYSKDEAITTVLNHLSGKLNETIEGFDLFARKQSDVRPTLTKTLIVVTEWNALVDNTKMTNDPKSSPAVAAIRPILQQGNGYKYKVVLDGQNIAVGESGISEALREQISICLVGATTCDLGVVGELGGTKKQKEQIVEECSALRKAEKRACVIQLGEGEPAVGVVPEMPWLRHFRFDSATLNSAQPIQQQSPTANQNSIKTGMDAIISLLPENPTDADIINAYEQVSRSPAPSNLTERNNLIKYIRDYLQNGEG